MSDELEKLETTLISKIKEFLNKYRLSEDEVAALNAHTKLLDVLLSNKNYGGLLKAEQLKILYQSTKDDITRRKREGTGEES